MGSNYIYYTNTSRVRKIIQEYCHNDSIIFLLTQLAELQYYCTMIPMQARPVFVKVGGVPSGRFSNS